MDRSELIYLVKEVKTKDNLGVYHTEPVKRRVFCNVSSISAAEFFDGGRAGLNPAFRMSLFYADYDGEQILEYKGKNYAIYRTFLKGTDTLELYVERKGGTNG